MERSDFTQEVVDGWTQLRNNEDLAGLGSAHRLLWSGRVVDSILDTIAQESGFGSRGDYEVAALLRRSEPKLLTPTRVAHSLMLSPSGITGRLDRLEKQRFLARRFDDNDRRALRLTLTPEGREAVDAAFEKNLELYDRFFASLSEEERETLDRLLGAVLVELDVIKGDL